jgi:hypothetical protein
MGWSGALWEAVVGVGKRTSGAKARLGSQVFGMTEVVPLRSGCLQVSVPSGAKALGMG